MESKRLELKMRIVYLVAFGALATFLPFLTVYLQAKGLDYGEIGILLAVFSITGVIVQPIWGYLTDKYLDKQKTILILMLGSAVAALAFSISFTFLALLLSIILFLSLHSPIVPVLDAYSYEIIEDHKTILYGRLRVMGSLGYALSALGMGLVVDRMGVTPIFYFYTGFILIAAAFTLRIRHQGKSTYEKLRMADVGRLMKDSRFLVYILALGIMNIAIGSTNSYLPILVLETGGQLGHIGLISFMIAMSELPFFFFGDSFIRKYGVLNIFGIGMVVYAGMYFTDSFLTNYVAVLFVQLFQGVAFSFFIIAGLHYLNSIVAQNMKTTAMTLYGAVTGVGHFTGNAAGGFLLENATVFLLFRILAFVALIAFVFVLILKRTDRKQHTILDQQEENLS
jgi:MFS family permease